MKQALKDGLSYILSLLAAAATPAIQRMLADWSTSLFTDVPSVAGAWVIAFMEPAQPGSGRPRRIDAVFQQFGRRLEGTGHIQGEPGDPFVYHARVKRNAVYGEFSRRDRRVLAGTGTFVLKVSADGRSLSGLCTWYDSDLDDVWSSPYRWARRG